MKKVHVIISSFFLVVALVFIYFGTTSLVLDTDNLLQVRTFEPIQKTKYHESVEYWQARITSTGGEESFDEMVVTGNKLRSSEAHTLAHSFGEALYKTLGVTGLESCKSNFVYGCFHQFIGTAISELGKSSIDSMVATCEKNTGRTACLHGMGHGLIGHLGYSIGDLRSALAICAEFEDGPLGYCADGVFMEYNIRSLASYEADFFIPRPYSEELAFEPCMSQVEELDRPACIYELPVWWVASYGLQSKGDERSFLLAGDQCSKLDSKNAEICFSGLGYIAGALANLSLEKGKEVCEAVTENALYRNVCLTGVARRFKVAKVPMSPREVCTELGLSSNWLEHCEQYVVSGNKNTPSPK